RSEGTIGRADVDAGAAAITPQGRGNTEGGLDIDDPRSLHGNIGDPVPWVCAYSALVIDNLARRPRSMICRHSTMRTRAPRPTSAVSRPAANCEQASRQYCRQESERNMSLPEDWCLPILSPSVSLDLPGI